MNDGVLPIGEHGSGPIDDVGDVVHEAADRFEVLGRVGWVAKGVVYVLIGYLFVGIGLGGASQSEANQAGAIEAIADTPGGRAILVALGFGLALYAVWRIFTVVLPGDWTGRALLDRIGYLVSAAIYMVLLATIFEIVVTGRDTGSGEDRTIEALVKDVLSVTAGRTLVIIAGVVVIGIGVAFAHKGVTRSFRSQISGDDGLEGSMIDRLGTIGWIARGLSMAIIGVLLIRAAWLFRPDEAAGLDDSIRQLSDTPAGVALAVACGVGFICYGVFAALSARHRDLKGPRNEH